MLKRSYIQRKPYQWKASRRRLLNRAGKRLRAKPHPELVEWSRQVLERDGHHCRWPECSEQGPQVVAHHIQTRRQRPDLKLVVSNGAAICNRHHDLLHHTLNGRRRARELGLLGGETYEKAMKQKEAA